MLNLMDVKAQANLLALCGEITRLKKVASTGGGEWAGPCPFCPDRGVDRFRVQPFARPYPRWMCRRCTAGRWDSVIGFIARRDQLNPRNPADLAEICRRAGSRADSPGNAWPMPFSDPPAYAPPDAAWQAAAQEVIARCEACLWQPEGERARTYLFSRGLTQATLRHFQIGFCASAGPDAFGRTIAGLYVPRGLVIPCTAAGVTWYLKVRLVPGIPCRCARCHAGLPGPGRCPKCGQDTRYLGVKGNKPAALFNADALTSGQNLALFCEGEIDCMTAAQEFGEIVPATTIGGSASNRLDLATWGLYLKPFQSFLVAYDADAAGQAGAAWLENLSDRVCPVALPEGFKDINDFHQRGGDLLDWILDQQWRVLWDLRG